VGEVSGEKRRERGGVREVASGRGGGEKRRGEMEKEGGEKRGGNGGSGRDENDVESPLRKRGGGGENRQGPPQSLEGGKVLCEQRFRILRIREQGKWSKQKKRT